MQITGDLKPISSGPVDPTATFSDANYEIGGTLDLASKFTSNSEGAVTYTVKDAGTTGATIAGSNFTATAVGTAIVTASQAAVADKFNAGTWDATITVTAPVAKYAVNFAAGDGTGSMDALEYAEGAEVTLPACTFTAPAGKEFDAWTSTDVTFTDGKFTMPANAVTITATWKDLPAVDYIIKIEPTSKTAFTITGTIGGTGAVATLGGPDTDGGYKLNSEGAYMSFTLASGNFEPGDKVIAYCTTAQSKKFTVSTGTTEASVIGSTSGNWVKGENVYVLPETLGENVNTLYVARIGSGTYAQNPNILWIKVVRPAKHDVIFAAGDGTGSMETKQVAEGANYTIPNCTFTAPTGKEFDAWTSSDVTITDGKFTMPANNVTLTATWKTSVTKHTVIYMDGAVELGSEQVVSGEKAANVPSPKKELNTFAGWEDAEHNAIDFATKTIDADLTVYAKWTAFGEATSIDIEQFVIDNTKSGDIKAELTAHNFDYNLESGDELDGLDDAKDYKNVAFRGLKMKHNGTYVVANIPAGKLVDVVIGNLGAAKVQINGVDAARALVAGAGSGDKTVLENYKNSHNYYYSETAAVLKVLSTGTSTTVLKGINFLDPFVVTFANGGEIDPKTFTGTALTLPAATGEGEFQGWYDAETAGNKVGDAGDAYTPAGDITLFAQFSAQSSDNSLKTLKYGETSILEADKYTYDIVLPYKSVIPASVTYEANSLVATPAGEQTATVTDGTATFTITAENGDAAEYTVNFTVAKKDAIEILGTTVTGQKAHGEMTGLFSEGAEADLYVSSSYKLDKDRYVGLTLPEGKKFAAGDIVAIDVKTIQGCVGFTLFTDKGTTLIIDTRDGNAVSTGWNYVTLPEDYVGSQSIYLYRVNNSEANMNPEVNGMKVLRVMNPVLTALTVAGVDAVIDQEAKTISVKLDNGTDAATAELVPTIVANGGEPTAALDGTLAYDTPINYVVTDKDGDQTTYVLTATQAAAPAATPTITTQPASHNYLDTEVIAALTVEATVSDEGVLSYQWYKGEDAIADATAATYTPTEAGSYKVVVTNTLGEETATATSDVAVITVSHIYTFNDWNGSSVNFTKAGEWTMYSVSSTNGKINGATQASNFAANQTIENGDNVKAYTAKYFVVKFENDVEAVTFNTYANNSTLRTFKALKAAENETAAVAGTYSAIDFAGKVARTVSSETRGNSYTFITENILFEAGKYYYFELSNAMPLYDFFYTLAPEKSADPAVATLVAETVCSDGTFATLDAVTAAESTYSYQWYKDEAEFATTQTIDPVDGGVYYCVVTNSETDKRAATKETNKVTLVRLTSGTTVSVEDGLAKTGETVELTATAAGAGTLTYAWYTCDDAEGTNPVVIGGETNATYTATVGAATAYYMVEVTADCGTASAVATVNVKPETYELQDVTGNMTWDFTNKAAADGDKAVADADKGSYVVLANTEIKSTFANAEYMAANYNKYTAKAIQAAGLKIHTTVPGFVIVTFAQTGGDKVRELYINGVATGATPNGTTNMTYTQYVEAGDVVLTSWEASTSKWQMFNYAKIEFVTELADSKFESVRTLSSSNIGTICLQKGVAAFKGATFYEIAYVEMQAGEPYKVFFDEVEKLEAGHAYIFEPEEDATEILVAYDGVTAAAPVAVNGLHGTFEAIAASETNELVGNYIVNSNQIRKCGINCSLGANRAYIKMNEVTGYPVAPAPGRRRISLGNQDSQVTTDIENLNGETEPMKVLINGQVFILRGAKMYNAQGQLVK